MTSKDDIKGLVSLSSFVHDEKYFPWDLSSTYFLEGGGGGRRKGGVGEQHLGEEGNVRHMITRSPTHPESIE